MNVHIERDKRTEQRTFTGTAKELLTALEINPETVLIIRNDELVTEDEQLSNEDEIRILTVVSGG